MRKFARLIFIKGEPYLEEVEATLTSSEMKRRKKTRKRACLSRRINRLVRQHKRH